MAMAAALPDATPSSTRDGELRRSFVGAACQASQPLLLSALSVPAMAYIIRRLGPAEYGEWSAAAALVAAVSVLSNLGLRGSFVRTVAQNPAGAAAALAGQLGTRTLLAIPVALLATLLAACLGYGITIVACVAITVSGLLPVAVWTSVSDMLDGLRRHPTASLVATVGGLVLTAASVVAVWAYPRAIPLSAAYLVGPIASGIVSICILRRSGIRIAIDFNLHRAAILFWGGRHFAAQQVLYAASAGLPLLLLPKLSGVAVAGVFAAGTLLISRLSILPDALATAFYPLLAKTAALEPAYFRRRLFTGFLVTSILCVVTGAPIFLGADLIASIFFPLSPQVCARIIAITIVALPLVGIERMAVNTINALGDEKKQARAALAAATLAISFGAAATYEWGVYGASAFIIARPIIQIACLVAFASRELATLLRASSKITPVRLSLNP
jgi:O-antigen/teichoic acid export membrane protein